MAHPFSLHGDHLYHTWQPCGAFFEFSHKNTDDDENQRAAIWRQKLRHQRKLLLWHLTTKLHDAAKQGDIKLIKKIIQSAEENLLTSLTSPQVKQQTTVDILKALTDNEDEKDCFATPLLQAASNGHVDVVRYLVERHSVDITAKRKDDGQLSAIHLAAQSGHLDVVAYLIHVKPEFFDSTTKNGDTPLILAAYNGHMAIVEYLVASKRVDTNRRGLNGRTPLMAAASGGHVDIIDFLIKSGAKLDKIGLQFIT